MSLNVETDLSINAPPDRVWAVLRDLPRFAQWNSRTHFAKPPAVGRRQIMRVRLFGRWLAVPVRIQTCDAASGLRWQGGIPGVCTGSHYFRLEDAGDGACRLIQGEDFKGVLLPALWPLIERELRELYDGLNRELKAHVEAADGGR